MFFKKKTKDKVFCIGRNKTGSTSIEKALKNMGYRLGVQATAELFTPDWKQRNFENIIKFCKTADAFQDSPFSLGYTYQALDAAFPGSKFILTIRNSGEEWYASLVRFHTKLIGKNRVPTAQDLQEFGYRHRGWMWEQTQAVFGVNEATLYDKDIYIKHYDDHNRRAIEYFRYRPNDFLVLNLADQSAMQDLCEFLNVDFCGQEMPHLNKSA